MSAYPIVGLALVALCAFTTGFTIPQSLSVAIALSSDSGAVSFIKDFIVNSVLSPRPHLLDKVLVVYFA